MRYLGGKSRFGKQIAVYIESVRRNNQVYLEPFVGSAYVMQHISGKRIGADIFNPVISMWQELQKGWIPPCVVSEQEYVEAKNYVNLPPHLISYVGIGCSFGGKLWGGFARDKQTGRDITRENYRGVMRKSLNLRGVYFDTVSYNEWKPKDWIIYCDPPYNNTEQYKGVPLFNTELFWDIMRIWSQNNTVLISEYNAPEDFKAVLTYKTKVSIGLHTQRSDRVEKVYMRNE